jgi:hypothetical protein
MQSPATATAPKGFRFFRKWLQPLLAMVILPGICQATADTFTASLSSGTVAVGDQFQITFTLNGNGRGFKAPSFEDFNVLMGPSQSSNIQMINGSFSQSLSFTYVLQAVKEGTFRIGSAEIVLNNQKVLSNPVTVTVTKGTSRSQQGGGSGSGEPMTKSVFIRASVDKSSVFRGEGLVVTYRMYTRVTLVNYTISKLPAPNGFWSQDIPLAQQLEFHNENVDGVNYQVADLKKMVLFPQRSGTLILDPMEGEVIARVQVKRQRSNDPFDQFFGNDPFGSFFGGGLQEIKVPLRSQQVQINVRELPAGAPAGFTGAVGKFSFETSLDKSRTKSNEAVTLKLKITGKGNIKLIDAPKVTFPPDFETYDPKEAVNATTGSGGVSGTKTFEYLVIPRNAGNFKVTVDPFSYFDLEKKAYVEVPATTLDLEVEKGSETVTTTVSGVSKSEVQLLGRDIRFLKTGDPHLLLHPIPFRNSWIFYALLLAPFILLAIALQWRRKLAERMANASLLRSQRAIKIALRRLSKARELLNRGERSAFLEELSRAVWGYISDKLQLPVANLNRENAKALLLQRGTSESQVQGLLGVLDDCEFARFAGAAVVDPEALYKRGIDTITQMEEAV